MRQVLFLCTANYYRSRFAELLFSFLAASQLPGWVADSRGIATELGVNNIGPISPHAVAALKIRGIVLNGDTRWPRQVEEPHFAAADLVIALDEEEHYPYMMDRFPAWAGKIQYWHVADTHLASPSVALPLAELEIVSLLRRLAA